MKTSHLDNITHLATKLHTKQGVPEVPNGNNNSFTGDIRTLRTWVEDGVFINGVHHMPVSEWSLDIRDQE